MTRLELYRLTDDIPQHCGCKGSGWIPDGTQRVACPLHHQKGEEINGPSVIRLLECRAYTKIKDDTLDEFALLGYPLGTAEKMWNRFTEHVAGHVPKFMFSMRDVEKEKDRAILKSKNWFVKKTDIEYFFVDKPYRADCVWFLYKNTEEMPPFHIIHEVKTGKYNLNKEIKKHYLGKRTQLWIWAWDKYHLNQKKNDDPTIKLIKLEYITPLVIKHLKSIIEEMELTK
jgi:hypothetical protein